jgi:hypothetical protein
MNKKAPGPYVKDNSTFISGNYSLDGRLMASEMMRFNDATKSSRVTHFAMTAFCMVALAPYLNAQAFSVKHSFQGPPDGSNAFAGLVLDHARPRLRDRETLRFQQSGIPLGISRTARFVHHFVAGEELTLKKRQ